MPVAVPRNEEQPGATGGNLWEAAGGEGNLARVRYWIDDQGMSPTAADTFTYTPVHAAASWGRPDILRYLLTHPRCPKGAVDVLDSDGDSPLFVTETEQMARILVEEFGADAKRTNKEGRTPMEAALEEENDDVAAYLSQLTGVPLPAGATEDDDEEEGEDDGETQEQQDGADTEEDRITAQRTEEMMRRVEVIMRRAEQRQGADQDPSRQVELNEEEEQELRGIVGESVVRQILEGWQRAAGGEA